MAFPAIQRSIADRLCCLEKGAKGVEDLTGTVEALQVTVAILQEEVDLLQQQIGYTPISITSFTVSPAISEIGSTLSSLTFNWSLNKTAVSQSISPTVGVVAPPATTKTAAVSINSNTTYTLTVDDGTAFPGHTDSDTVTVSFRHKAYWGTSAATSLDSSGILALANAAFSTGRARSFTLNGNNQYIYYAYPNSYDSGGDATFTVNGFPTSGWVKTTVNFTNVSGNTTLFSVYRSAEIQSGSSIQVAVT